ncbi:hypothetical protein LCGC14_1262900 [marine sediment metagenome]|uniref:Uncharacterized protein n=1 Tax=marine sediment metagenome TaxID=412755 RepID=A0A0F9P3K0_9ZZZZ
MHWLCADRMLADSVDQATRDENAGRLNHIVGLRNWLVQTKPAFVAWKILRQVLDLATFTCVICGQSAQYRVNTDGYCRAHKRRAAVRLERYRTTWYDVDARAAMFNDSERGRRSSERHRNKGRSVEGHRARR